MTRASAEQEAERQAKQAAWEAEQNRPVSIILEGDTIVVTFGYRAERVADVKDIPGRRFHPDDKSWRMPLRPEALEPLQTFATVHDAVIPDAILAPLSQAKEQAHVLLQASQAEDADLHIDGLGGELRPFQRAGVAYAAHRERCLIGDSMGLGKTPQALATLLYTAAFPAVIVCPASLKLNWQREAQKWLPSKTVEVWQGSRNNYWVKSHKRVESSTGAVAVGLRSSCCRPLSLSVGASVQPLPPFPVPAHQTGRADFLHPAFGQSITLSSTDGYA